MKKLSKLMALLLALVLLMSIAAPAIAVEEKREDISSQEYSELLNAALQSSSTYAAQNVTLAFVDEDGNTIQNSTSYPINSSVSCNTIASSNPIAGYEYDYAYIYGDLGYLTLTITELRLKNSKIQYKATWGWNDLSGRTVYLVYKKTEETPTDDKVRVYVYVAGAAWKNNVEFQDLIGLHTCDTNGYFPAGEIELDASYFQGKNSTSVGAPLINSSSDWDKLLAALGVIDTKTLNTAFSANRGNKVGEYLSQAQKDINAGMGSQKSALFRWNGSTSYGFVDQSVQYHLDLCFNLNTITFITGNNGITSGVAADNTTVDTRAYITGSLIQEPRNLNIPAGYQFVGYYTNANFTTPWNGIGTPLNEDITVYIKITPLDNVIIYYKVATGGGGTVSPDSEGLNPETGIAQGSTATANANYTFVGWYSDEACTEGTKVSNEANYVPQKPEGDWVSTTYYAKFEEKKATINYEVVGDGGTVSRDSETLKVLSGTAQGSTASANEYYDFVGWYSDEDCKTLVSTNVSYTPSKVGGVWKSATYYAKFVEEKVTINYEVVGNVGGKVTLPSETVNVKSGPVQGSTATANTGYTFKGWYKEQACTTLVSNSNTLTPQKNANDVYEAATYYAKFEENEVTITYTVSGGVGGTVAIEGSDPGLSVFEKVSCVTGSVKGSTPTASAGYTFDGWYTDPTCNTKVDTTWVASGKLTPQKNANGVYETATYYAKFVELEATINYQVVGPDGCGTVKLSTTSVEVAGSDTVSELVRMATGQAVGAYASPSSTTYKFVGWYKDEDCTQSVDTSWVGENNKLTPKKDDDAVWVNGTTYYAKFEYNLTTLTITKTGLTQTSTEDWESAIITVTDNVTNTVVARVALQNNSVTIDGLTVGRSYTVAEENSWTWRYAAVSSNTFNLQPPETGNQVTVNNRQNNDKWLGGDNYKVNKFAASSNTTD